MAWHDSWSSMKRKKPQPQGQTRSASKRGGRSAGVAKQTTAAKDGDSKPSRR
jgi:hypothetical protein